MAIDRHTVGEVSVSGIENNTFRIIPFPQLQLELATSELVLHHNVRELVLDGSYITLIFTYIIILPPLFFFLAESCLVVFLKAV